MNKPYDHSHLKNKILIDVNNLNVSYGSQKIIKSVDFSIKQNHFTTILGINGSGKSTIIKAIIGLIKYKGVVKLGTEDIKTIKKKDLAKKISYVPQLFNNRGDVSVYDYISFGRFPHTNHGFLSKNDKNIIDNVIESLKIKNISHKLINEISGGQRQKVAIAAALVQDTDIIILDEPTTYLDIKNQYEILEIAYLLHLKGKTVVMVLHDISQAIRYSDDIILLKDSKIFKAGPPEKVMTSENIEKVFNVKTTLKKIGKRNNIFDIDTESIRKEIKWF